MNIISIINQKGGVGKTTVTVNLAAALAKREQSVLVIDLDSQANATSVLHPETNEHLIDHSSIFDALNDSHRKPVNLIDAIRRTPIPNVSLAVGDRAMAGLEWVLRESVGREMLLHEAIHSMHRFPFYDFVLIDNTPALGLGPAMSLVASDTVIVPVPCQPLDLTGLQLVEDTISKVKARLNPRLKRRVLLTRLDNRTAHPPVIAKQLRAQFGADVFDTTIMESATLQRAAMNRECGGSVLAYDPNSAAAGWFLDLADEVLAASGGEGNG